MGRPFRDLENQRFTRLVVIGKSFKKVDEKQRTVRVWPVRCDCGGCTEVPAESLLRGATRSCGCIRVERARETQKWRVEGLPRCPCCSQTIKIETKIPAVSLGPVQQRMFNILKKNPDGLTRGEIAAKLYESSQDGGQNSTNIVSVMAKHLNAKLAKVNLRIVSRGGPGSVYRLIAEKDYAKWLMIKN